MKLFLDSANIFEIEESIKRGFLSGVTTNPTLVSKEFYIDYHQHIRNIVDLLNSYETKVPLSIEVTSSDEHEMRKEIYEFISMGYKQLYIKIPIGWNELKLIREIHAVGGRVNCTACMSANQAFIAASAGVTFVSLFWGRIRDGGENPARTVRQVRRVFRDLVSPPEIIVGSIRTTDDITDALVAGADIVTVPPKFLKEMCCHPKTDEVIAQFLNDFAQRRCN